MRNLIQQKSLLRFLVCRHNERDEHGNHDKEEDDDESIEEYGREIGVDGAQGSDVESAHQRAERGQKRLEEVSPAWIFVPKTASNK